MLFRYAGVIAINPNTDQTEIVKSATGTVHLNEDWETTVQVHDVNGFAMTTLNTTVEGLFPDFYIEDQPVVGFKTSSGHRFYLRSSTPVPGPSGPVPVSVGASNGAFTFEYPDGTIIGGPAIPASEELGDDQIAQLLGAPDTATGRAVQVRVADAVAADSTVTNAATTAVSNAAAELELVESVNAPSTGDAEGGLLDNDNRVTWLTHDDTGGPTAYARKRLGLHETDHDIAGGFTDRDLRQTDLVFGKDGHVPERVINLWGARIQAAQGLTTTDIRVFWGHSMAWGQTNGATPIGTYLTPLIGKTVVNRGVGGELSSQIGARVLADQQYRAAVTYLWPARNDLNKAGTSPEQAVYWIRRMLEHETPVRRKALIFEEPPTNSETFGSSARTATNGLDAYNEAIKTTFPDYWVPLASWMLTDAAAAAVGHTWTAEDNTARANGTTPPSFLSDTIHYNSLGNQAAAHRIRQEEQNRGWI